MSMPNRTKNIKLGMEERAAKNRVKIKVSVNIKITVMSSLLFLMVAAKTEKLKLNTRMEMSQIKINFPKSVNFFMV
jgi:hypothetical protein